MDEGEPTDERGKGEPCLERGVSSMFCDSRTGSEGGLGEVRGELESQTELMLDQLRACFLLIKI